LACSATSLRGKEEQFANGNLDIGGIELLLG
jgi:hypothetical protein